MAEVRQYSRVVGTNPTTTPRRNEDERTDGTVPKKETKLATRLSGSIREYLDVEIIPIEWSWRKSGTHDIGVNKYDNRPLLGEQRRYD
jgi:hypothetical protein